MFQAPCRASAAMARVVPKGGRNDDGPHASLDSIGRPLSACNRPNLPFRFPAKIAHSASRPSFLGTRVLARPRAFSSALRPAFRANAARFRAAARFHVKVSPPRRSRAGARALGSSRRAGRWFNSHLILGTGVSGGAEVPALAKSPFRCLMLRPEPDVVRKRAPGARGASRTPNPPGRRKIMPGTKVALGFAKNRRRIPATAGWPIPCEIKVLCWTWAPTSRF